MNFASRLARKLIDLQRTRKLTVLNDNLGAYAIERRRVERMESDTADTATSLPIDYPLTVTSEYQEV